MTIGVDTLNERGIMALAFDKYSLRVSKPLVPPLIFLVTPTTSSLSARELMSRDFQYSIAVRTDTSAVAANPGLCSRSMPIFTPTFL